MPEGGCYRKSRPIMQKNPPPSPRKLHLITYGCQMNEYDSERVAGLLKQERYELTDSAEDADLILLNTCSIREKAEDKVYSQLGALRLLKRRRPDLTIGVMGCMAQLQKGRIQERAPYVDLCLLYTSDAADE